MSGPLGSSQWMYKAGEAFTINQSLRFNDDDAAFLSRTFVTPTNTDIFTISCWVKRGNLSAASTDSVVGFFGQSVGSDWGLINFDGNDKLYWRDRPGGAENVVLKTTRKFRDLSAWYHLVFIYDSTDGTEGDRAQIWVNGVRETVFDDGEEEYPALNANSTWNTAGIRTIGGYNASTIEQEYDGYLAEVHMTDGTAVAASSFGETGTYGEWKPKEVTGLTYGNNGFYLTFAGGGIIAATGGTITTDGDYKVHSFTSNGTFTPTSITGTQGMVEYLVIAGGGGGAGTGAYGSGPGGGGAGGYRTGYLEVDTEAYSITVGALGAGGDMTVTANGATGNGANGGDSIFSTITSTGGGGGSREGGGAGADGGSGGGSGALYGSTYASGSGIAGQGYAGADGTASGGNQGGAGGGAGARGTAHGGSADNTPKAGGVGLASSITGSSVYRGGGGGGGSYQQTPGAGGNGGGGGGGGNRQDGVAATANTGGGGGGAGSHDGIYEGGNGGSGIVIIRYKFQ